MSEAKKKEREANMLANMARLMAQIKKQPKWLECRNTGILLHEKMKYSQALAKYEESITEYNEDTDNMKSIKHGVDYFVPETLNKMGVTYLTMGKTQQAIDTFLDAISKCRNQSKQMVYKFNLAESYNMNGQSGDSIITYKELLQEYEADNDKDSTENRAKRALIAYNLANLYYSMRSFKKSEPMARKSLVLRRSVFGVKEASAELTSSLCMLSCVLGSPKIAKYEEADYLAREALEMAGKCDASRFPGGDKAGQISRIENIINKLSMERRARDQEAAAAAADDVE